ncbi:MAG: YicC family protein [Proteobacteria bacterium]|nr:YicC family protein [Pseudomonadota bacterium]
MKVMNAYGKGEASNGAISVIVEVRSLANRHRDLQFRLPREYLSLESRLRNIVLSHIDRGRLEIYIQRKPIEGTKEVLLDRTLAENYISCLESLVSNTTLKETLQKNNSEAPLFPLNELIKMPGVLCVVEKEPETTLEWPLLSTALEMGLLDMLDRRKKDGLVYKNQILTILKDLQKLRSTIQEHSSSLNQHLFLRFQKRLIRLLGDQLDPDRLTHEAALLAEKSDITEELLRLQMRLDMLQKQLSHDAPSGRKLDYIAQEISKEINILNSKSNNHHAMTAILDFKSQLEKLRELISNIE